VPQISYCLPLDAPKREKTEFVDIIGKFAECIFNMLQEIAEASSLGIPILFSTNPCHGPTPGRSLSVVLSIFLRGLARRARQVLLHPEITALPENLARLWPKNLS